MFGDKTNHNKWDFREKITFESVLDIDSLPTFFIYLIDDKKRICYYRDNFWGKDDGHHDGHHNDEDFVAKKIKRQ